MRKLDILTNSIQKKPLSHDLFEFGGEYDNMLHRGLKITGEDKHYFAEGRIRDLRSHLPHDFRPKRILDFGCGIGETTKLLAETFREAEIIGVDTATNALAHAEKIYGSSRISFCSFELFLETGTIDLCYTNGVFHHIQPEERAGVLKMIYRWLVLGGYFALFENNPWNLGTRLVMKLIPFDRDAKPLTSSQSRRLLYETGFGYCAPARFLFYFPRLLAFLRFSESWMARLPLGAQYYILTRK